MMAKLYKKEGKNYSYWEIWDNHNVITVHWGTLGELGYSKEITLELRQNLHDIFRKAIDAAKKEGFSAISPKDHYQLIVQFKTESMPPSTRALNERVHIENLINHSFGWIGIGHSDGGDIGNGTMNIIPCHKKAIVRHERIYRLIPS